MAVHEVNLDSEEELMLAIAARRAGASRPVMLRRLIDAGLLETRNALSSTIGKLALRPDQAKRLLELLE